MVSNQIEFNEKYSKEILEIKLKDEDFDEEQLVIENYLNLEKLYLRDIDSIGKIILKDLPKLKECTIWGCETKDLIIDNCPQLKTLNVRNNSLTNLEFLLNLENLEALEVDGNTELVEILKPYKSDSDKDGWKTYQKDIQEIFELTKQNNPQELVKKFWDLKKSREDLKKNVSFLLSKENQQKTISKPINTKELVLSLEKELTKARDRAEEREKKIEEISKLEAVIKNPVYKAVISFLRAKLVFLNARRGTIEELKELCNELEKFLNNKNAKIAIVGEAISITGAAASSTQIYGVIPTTLGESIKVWNQFSKIKFIAKSSEEFQILLKNEDELSKLDNAYSSLINLSSIDILHLKNRQVYGKKHLFSADCEIPAILESKGIWEGKLLDGDAMETAIKSLSENLKELGEEWNKQFEEFKNKLKFGKEYTSFFEQEKETREEIRKLQSQLGKSINAAKNRLESKKWWDTSEEKEKKTKDRQLLFEKFLKDKTSLNSSEKTLLEKKLTKEGLDNLSQKKEKLAELQKELDKLLEQEKNFQAQVQVSSK
ncbi:MAG: hypothetical protein I3273_02955 [Candidatus Moeniiplasma glomeromycotorum]|nr:hypothetical protein [Candidatus Moeniiplasma glomeromycotorum]MCE8167583.1 hypothetical protein [Candidatus Moeniiplasma glomeromycotorum]MCE8169065.1 hypothetical protein [Candidatus Moeniiplasma glomeromycotorum]